MHLIHLRLELIGQVLVAGQGRQLQHLIFLLSVLLNPTHFLDEGQVLHFAHVIVETLLERLPVILKLSLDVQRMP